MKNARYCSIVGEGVSAESGQETLVLGNNLTPEESSSEEFAERSAPVTLRFISFFHR